MKLKTSVSLMVALVLGLVTAKVGVDMLRKYGSGPASTVSVVMAKSDLEPGKVIGEQDVTLVDMPVALVPAKALRNTKDAVGRTVLSSLLTGSYVADNALAAKGAGSGLEAMVPKGMRAVTIDVSDSSSVANMLTPGVAVDVIATLRKNDTTLAKTIVENVKVQYIQRQKTGMSFRDGREVSSDNNGPIKTVTLLVTAKQAATIDLANSMGGKPRLVLRGNADATALGEGGSISENELLGLPDAPKAEEPGPKPQQDDSTFANVPPASEPDNRRPVQIIRGGQESTIYYDKEGNGQEAGHETTPTTRRSSEGIKATANQRSGDDSRTASGK
jgi:pilus assembly protein CpaB